MGAQAPDAQITRLLPPPRPLPPLPRPPAAPIALIHIRNQLILAFGPLEQLGQRSAAKANLWWQRPQKETGTCSTMTASFPSPAVTLCEADES